MPSSAHPRANHRRAQGLGLSSRIVRKSRETFFDSVPWDLVIKAVTAHLNTEERWVVLYVKRWLAAPIQQPDGTVQQRDRGTPQGSAVSPVLANLFLHYAFDAWMAREFPTVPFERYADDGAPRTLMEVAM